MYLTRDRYVAIAKELKEYHSALREVGFDDYTAMQLVGQLQTSLFLRALDEALKSGQVD